MYYYFLIRLFIFQQFLEKSFDPVFPVPVFAPFLSEGYKFKIGHFVFLFSFFKAFKFECFNRVFLVASESGVDKYS